MVCVPLVLCCAGSPDFNVDIEAALVHYSDLQPQLNREYQHLGVLTPGTQVYCALEQVLPEKLAIAVLLL